VAGWKGKSYRDGLKKQGGPGRNKTNLFFGVAVWGEGATPHFYISYMPKLYDNRVIYIRVRS